MYVHYLGYLWLWNFYDFSAHLIMAVERISGLFCPRTWVSYVTLHRVRSLPRLPVIVERLRLFCSPHMTRWPPCPYMVIFFGRPKGRWPWKLVCSIGCSNTTKFVQIMTLGWPWPILVPYSFVINNGEKGKTMDFSETIVVFDIKVGRCG